MTLVTICESASWKTGGPDGALIRALVIPKSNTNTIYAATGFGGVFKSTNGAETWQSINDGLPGRIPNALASNPTGKVLYTGFLNFGIFKSVNGGQKWFSANQGLSDQDVWSIAVDANTPKTVYAGTQDNQDGHVFISEDAGANWTDRSNGLTGAVVHAIAIDPFRPGTIYAGTNSSISVSFDSGLHWTSQSKPSTNDFAFDPVVPDVVYAATTNGIYRTVNAGQQWDPFFIPSDLSRGVSGIEIDPGNPDVLYANTDIGVFKTTNQGESWDLIQYGLPIVWQGPLVLDLLNPQVLYVGGNIFQTKGVFKTINGGTSWSPSSKGLSVTIVLKLEKGAGENAPVYAGAFFSDTLFRSDDGGLSWMNLPEFETTATFKFAADPVTPDVVYISPGEGLYKSFDRGASWSLISTQSLGSLLAIDPLDASTMYSWHDGVFKSIDGGLTWSLLSGGPSSPLHTLAFDTTQSGTIYAGTDSTGIFKSTDEGSSWIQINSGLGSLTVVSIVVDPANHNVLYAATAAGVFKSFDGGFNWTGKNSNLNGLFTSCLAVDPANTNRIFLGTAGGGVFVSEDGAESWKAMNKGLPNPISVRSLLFDSAHSRLYAGTFGNGVFSIEIP